MVVDIQKSLFDNIDRESSMAVLLPQALEQLESHDAAFEIVTSNTLIPLKLFYSHNIAVEISGAVFVQTKAVSFATKEDIDA